MNEKMLEKRIEILKQIDALLPKFDCQTALESIGCPNCVAIAIHGQKLLGLVNKRNTSILDNENYSPVKSSKLALTKEKYLTLKKANKTDE